MGRARFGFIDSHVQENNSMNDSNHHHSTFYDEAFDQMWVRVGDELWSGRMRFFVQDGLIHFRNSPLVVSTPVLGSHPVVEALAPEWLQTAQHTVAAATESKEPHAHWSFRMTELDYLDLDRIIREGAETGASEIQLRNPASLGCFVFVHNEHIGLVQDYARTKGLSSAWGHIVVDGTSWWQFFQPMLAQARAWRDFGGTAPPLTRSQIKKLKRERVTVVGII